MFEEIKNSYRSAVQTVQNWELAKKYSQLEKKFNEFKKFFSKPSGALCVLLPILLILLVLPVNMKDNSHLPVVGSMEKMGYEYSKDNLIKSSAAYATVKVIDKTISVIQSAEAPLPIFPVISFRPGEIFSAANDALQRMADALFWIMGISLSGTFLSGLLTFLSFKICFPLAIIFYLVMR